MNPFMVRKSDGRYWCHGCRLAITGLKDAETHGRYEHRIPYDFLAQDSEGDWYDLRGTNPPTTLRERGVI